MFSKHTAYVKLELSFTWKPLVLSSIPLEPNERVLTRLDLHEESKESETTAVSQKKLRFFHNKGGSGSANEVLYNLTTTYMTSSNFPTRASKLSIGR